MNYYESAEGIALTLAQVYDVLDQHGLVGQDRLYCVAMAKRVGSEFDAQSVLRSIGY